MQESGDRLYIYWASKSLSSSFVRLWIRVVLYTRIEGQKGFAIDE